MEGTISASKSVRWLESRVRMIGIWTRNEKYLTWGKMYISYPSGGALRVTTVIIRSTNSHKLCLT